MSEDTIRVQLAKLRNLSDDANEDTFTSGMQLEASALQNALDLKRR